MATEAGQRFVDIQREVSALPTEEEFNNWVNAVLDSEAHQDAELTIRIVSQDEIADLNQQYRYKTGATNVLSFPFEVPDEIDTTELNLPANLLGDLIICADVVKQQASEQGKEEIAHWAHMVVHGVLHLLGYDHMNESDAEIMETKEKTILSQLGYQDPYLEV